ncbi:MAG: FAD-dependent oxidoreductase [Burkholderiaceae bacterium]
MTEAIAAPCAADAIRCDLCIVGAGIAGLNALFSAARHLDANARVVLVDRREAAGGMWRDAYDFVRLHQPHGMFTVGNIRWTQGFAPEHLASKQEVRTHLEYCLAQLRKKVTLVELFGYEAREPSECVVGGESFCELLCERGEPDGGSRTVIAKRVIVASGYEVDALEPLSLSSENVVSVAPSKVLEAAAASDAPVFIVGFGKTAMDTALALLKQKPGRELNMITGSGNVFARREQFFPGGAAKWWSGMTTLTAFLDTCADYNGQNDDEAFAAFREKFTISPEPMAGERYFFGILSEAESKTIAEGVSRFTRGYLRDVIDTPDGPQGLMQDGSLCPIPAGALVVNCTGHLIRDKGPSHPFLSEGGLILRITTRSAVHFLTSVSAYFLTELFMSDRLRDVPLYALDMPALYDKDRKAWIMAATTLSTMNLLLFMQAVPFKVLDACGLDLDRWHPLHRRLLSLINAKRGESGKLSQMRASLDAVQSRFGVQCGRLPHPATPTRARLATAA